MPTLKKKKIDFTSLTSLPILNHTSQLSTQQQRLCDLIIEGEQEEEEEKEEEEEEELVQPPLYSLHVNRKSQNSEKLKSNPKKKQKSNFTYFRKSTKDPEDVCITEQPAAAPAEDVFSYCKLSSLEDDSCCAVLAAMYDSGNMSHSVISYRVYQHLQKLGSVPDLLDGVVGVFVQCGFGLRIKSLSEPLSVG